MEWLLKDLNERQLEAVTTTDGPLEIIAGAGSGKTRVLTRRLAYILVKRLAEPYQMLAVTFTNKAAGEMKARVSELMGTTLGELNVSTFHSFCARLLRREAHVLGYETSFTIFDQDDAEKLVKACIRELGFSEGQFPARGQLGKISDAKNELKSPEEFAAKSSGYFESRTAEIYKMYQRRLRDCNGMDFDDLLFNAVIILSQNAEVGERYRNRFKYLLVDEYQDTNRVQYLLLKALLGPHNNICVVGDEDQSIYGWRGADIRNILEFEKDFPGAKIIKLEQNYRSTNIILKAASSVIKNNTARKEKTLWAEADDGDRILLYLVDNADEEAIRIVDQIVSQRNTFTLKDTVILYRTNAQSRAFEEQLRRRNLPYQIIGGISFYQRKEIKDLMAYLKLIVNPKDDVSFERVVNYPKRGIGDKTIEAIQEIARREKKSEFEIVLEGSKHPELDGKIRRIDPFVAVIEKYQARVTTDPVDSIAADLVAEIKLLEELQSEDLVLGPNKVENIEAFIEGAAQFARGHETGSLVDYLAEISLYTDLDTYKEIEDKVTLMTLHAAKGLEFNSVFIVGLEEGLFPMQRAITEPMQLEEERRLFYVGATRARKRLHLATATTRFRFGEVQYIPSRFLKEIPENLIERRDFRTQQHFEYQRMDPSSAAANGSPQYTKTTVHNGEYSYEYDDDSPYKVGRIVMHPTFGRGKIVKREGMGDSLRLEIMFAGLGSKKIMAKYAKLKVVG
jgi:DNA helicase II / ATP-dependent DNA helicase PcrA